MELLYQLSYIGISMNNLQQKTGKYQRKFDRLYFLMKEDLNSKALDTVGISIFFVTLLLSALVVIQHEYKNRPAETIRQPGRHKIILNLAGTTIGSVNAYDWIASSFPILKTMPNGKVW